MQSLLLQCSNVLPTMQTCLTQMTQLFQLLSWGRAACDCGKSIDAVEAEDEARIIICRWKGCETLWVSVFGIISVSLLITDYAVPPFVYRTGLWYQQLDLWPMQEHREKQGKGRQTKMCSVDVRRQLTPCPKHVLFIAFTYIWKFILTPS